MLKKFNFNLLIFPSAYSLLRPYSYSICSIYLREEGLKRVSTKSVSFQAIIFLFKI